MKVPETPPTPTNEQLMEAVQKYIDTDERKRILAENQKYPYWTTIKYKYKEEAPLMWAALKLFRTTGSYHLPLAGIEFSWSITDSMHQLLHRLDLELGGTVGSSLPISERVNNQMLMNSIMEEAITSSMLEGAVTTKKAAREMIRKQAKPRSKTEYMILNNFHTMETLRTVKSEPLSESLIIKLHKSITNNTLKSGSVEGQFRKSNDVTVDDVIEGNTVHYPPDFGLINTMIQELIHWINNEKEFVHPIIKATILHFMMGYIHPFEDGNGRIGRTLFYWYLLKKGYWLLEFTSISSVILSESQSYYKAFLHSEQDELDIGYFLMHSLNTLQKALKKLHLYIEKKNTEREKSLQLNFLTQLNGRQKSLVNKIRFDPHMTIDTTEYKFRFRITYETSRKDLIGLQKEGFLVMRKEGKKKMIFSKSDQFDSLIERIPETGKSQVDLF